MTEPISMTAYWAETVERTALADLHAAATPDMRAALGLATETVDGALISIAAHDTSIVLNRTIGLAHAEPISAIAATYAQAGVERFFLHLYDEDRTPEIDRTLHAQGLEAARGWMKFHRRPSADVAAQSDLTVREIGSEHGPDMGRIVAAGFDLSDAAIPVLGALAGRDGWHVYMAFDGDTPAGTGSLFVHDGIGWLDWGATDPAFRRRGAQSALLAARIRHAYKLGCRHVFTATGEAVPGDPQHSYHNIERAGFTPFKVRGNYQPRR